MYKRIRYVSRYTKPMDGTALERLGEQAAAKNRELGVTGFLMASGGLFYQVIEGPPEAVDGLLASIEADERHTDIIMLGTEEGVSDRMFPDWAMKMVNLDAASHVRLLPLKVLMQTVYDQQKLLEKMTWGIERTLKHELGTAE
jgi:hypothetical protein